MTLRFIALTLFLLCWEGAAQRRSRPNAEPGSDLDILNSAVASFDGTLRLLNKKQILIEVGEDQTISIEVNKKTLFFRGAKPIAAREINIGSIVTVEAKKIANQLVALSVRIKEPPPGATR